MNDLTPLPENLAKHSFGQMFDALSDSSQTMSSFKKLATLKNYSELYEKYCTVYVSLYSDNDPFKDFDIDDFRITIAFISDGVAPDTFRADMAFSELLNKIIIECENEKKYLSVLNFNKKVGGQEDKESKDFIIDLIDTLLQDEGRKTSKISVYKQVALYLIQEPRTDDWDSCFAKLQEPPKGSDEEDEYVKAVEKVRKVYEARQKLTNNI
jgi:hypothetical protein